MQAIARPRTPCNKLRNTKRDLLLRDQFANSPLRECHQRIHLRLREGPAALHYLSSCARAGAATSVLAPLYAEAAFLTEQYRAVPGLLALGDPVGLAVPELRRLRAFWEGRDRP